MSHLTKNMVYLGDSIDILRTLPSESVDVVFADPPYNMQLRNTLRRPDETKVAGVFDDWDQFDSFQAYDSFSEAWLKECYRVLKPQGTLWVIGSYHNIYRLGTTLQNLGYWILNDIVWRKSNPMPNFRGTRFTNAHETLLWCSKSSDAKYFFNYEAMKSLNEGIQMRSDWTLPICSGGERLKDSSGQKLHSTQKPESLLYRVLLATTRVGDVVLDPFSGTGTTAAVAKRLGRSYVAIEQDPLYHAASLERLETIQVGDLAQLEAPRKQDVKRIPFGMLLEAGFLQAGEYLYDSKRSIKAKVRVDGKLEVEQNGQVGSIHQVGALFQGRETCNGWTYWHKQEGEQLRLIDSFRDQLRTSLI